MDDRNDLRQGGLLDLAVNGGLVADTRARCLVPLSVGVRDGRVAVLSDQPLRAACELDARGRVVSPGFIDVHGHVDGHDYAGELSVCQGITTTVGGNCGLSPVQMEPFFAQQEARGFCIHQAELVGHSFSLRREVGLLDPYQRAGEEHIARMCRLCDQALAEGACGVSFGLDYSPGASLREIEALAAVCAAYDRVMAVHTRLFTLYDLLSITEILHVAKVTGVPLLFSHFVYQYGEGVMDEALDMIERARSAGLRVRLDSGLYTDWATYIGTATFDEQTIRDNEMLFGDMLVATGSYAGRRLDERLYRKLRREDPDASVIYFTGKEHEIYDALKKDYCMPSTDIGAYEKGEGHPQIAGSFPRFIRRMVLEQGCLSMGEALYKAALLPAQTYSLQGKGALEPGMDADMVIFDPACICDTAQYPDRGRPDEKPQGIDYVLVDGVPVVDNGRFTGARPGRVLRHRVAPVTSDIAVPAYSGAAG